MKDNSMTETKPKRYTRKGLKPGTLTPSQIREMPQKWRYIYIDMLTPEQLAEVTEPCTGEAHGNPFIDNCGVCMGLTWGRQLKR